VPAAIAVWQAGRLREVNTLHFNRSCLVRAWWSTELCPGFWHLACTRAAVTASAWRVSRSTVMYRQQTVFYLPWVEVAICFPG
jgi:hypothetical protein